MTIAALPNCTDGSFANSSLMLCQYVAALVPPTLGCLPNQYLTLGAGAVCVDYDSSVQKVAGMLGAQGAINSGNTAWMLAASALVMIMTPGVGLFYGGLAGEETAGNTILMSFATMCVVTVQWFLFGYSFAFGPGTSGFGSFEWGGFVNVGLAPSGAYGANIPHNLWAAFQCMFAQITPALISGAVVGRMKFSSYMVFIFIWATLIYDPLAHWVWSFTLDSETFGLINLGFLGALGSIDFAGGTVIHISSGFAALAAALVLGPRHNAGKELKPHNIPMVVIGGTMLWFGWFGFNAGSAGAASSDAALAFWNTHLATAMAAIGWMACEKLSGGSPSPTGAAIGAVAGLVAITPGCGYVDTWAALLFGVFVSPFCFMATKLRAKIGLDDTLDVWAVHGVGGAVGAFMTGLFANYNVNGLTNNNGPINGAFFGNPVQLGYQMVAITVSASYSFFGTVIILLALKRVMGIRISDEAESVGIDVSEHGAAQYEEKRVVGRGNDKVQGA
jgi:Amt family ammonium transporter